MADMMEEVRAAKALADTKNNQKDEVAMFLGVFYPKMSKEEKQKILEDVER